MMRSRSVGNRTGGWWTGARLAGIGALVLLLLGGCEQGESPVSLEQPLSPVLLGSDLAGFSTDGVLMFLEPQDLDQQRSTQKLIYAARGGFVELNGFRVDIPPGSLPHNTVVTIELPTTLPEANYVVADFGPDGTSFRKPVQITMPLEGANLTGIEPSSLTVSFWDGTAWEDLGGTVTSSSIKAPTTHFSTYGVRSRGGIDTTSGG